MLTINKEVMLSINTNLDRPQARRVTFTTGGHNIFYLEMAMDRTEFVKLHDFERADQLNPDLIIEQTGRSRQTANSEAPPTAADAALLQELGL